MDNNKHSKILDQIKANSEKFLNYNRIKRNNLYISISDPQIIGLLESIPYLLDSNQPKLPGFVDSDKIPGGVEGYHPSSEAQNFIKSINPSAVILKKSASEKPFIRMFALMGSVGTIAFSKRSDFDFWICFYKEDFNSEAIRLFRIKCRKIEEWIAEKYNSEVHFYLNDITNVKNNIFDREKRV